MKYELTDESINYNGVTLHRIRALRDFGNVKKGDLGGFVEKEENLSHFGAAWIFDEANVFGGARVSDHAKVYEKADVFGHVKVCGNARISGTARLSGEVRIFGHTEISGIARISSDIKEVFEGNLAYAISSEKNRRGK